ncbi:hypothetical protein DH86_00001745, partial [Scytalidium sp. 3C]
NLSFNAYAAFALHFLTTPNLSSAFSGLGDLACNIDVALLSSALVKIFGSNLVEGTTSMGRLWLLAQFIAIHRLRYGNSQDPQFLRALSYQLSRASEDIIGRLDSSEAETLPESQEDAPGGSTIAVLPSIIKDEISSLVNQESITGLLAKFNIDHSKASIVETEDASLLASYALTLLRIFPRRGDEIRMWLYLGSMATPSGTGMPALKFFWQAMRSTNTFGAISNDPKAALNILGPQHGRRTHSETSDRIATGREWRTVLLFLELYTFVLRFTDDEEFLSGGVPAIVEPDTPVSRI